MVSRELEGLSVKLKIARFGPSFQELWWSKEFFSFEGSAGSTKTSSNIFLKNKKKLCHGRYVHTYKESFGSFHSD
jgi:hypothetical protein